MKKDIDFSTDWRIMGQEGYLKGAHLKYRKFDRSICFEDFTQCEFCWDGFDKDPDNPKYAYHAYEQRVWICEECFQDFREHFQWIVDE